MADPIEITNVGGEGVASEVTLANLLSVTEQMAKKAGIDPKDVNKKLSNLAKSTDDTIKVSSKNRDALKNHTKAVKESSLAIKSLRTGALSLVSVFGSAARSGVEITKAFIAGEKSLTAFASQLPLVGSSLSILTGLFDNSFTAFQNVAMSGAAFNNSLTELRDSAAGARLPLDEFVSLIGANSDKLASFGGTATDGAKRIAALNKALGSQRIDLMNMGLGFQEINEALIEYQYLTRAGNRGLRLSAAQEKEQAEAAAAYTKNLVTLGKLTGEDVKSQQAKIAQAQMDVAVQAKLATLSIEERKKYDQLFADTMQTGGEAAVNELNRQFLGMPPLTEEAALYTASFGENVNLIAQGLDAVYDGNVTAASFAESQSAYMIRMINNNAAAFSRLQPGLDAAAAGLDGPLATIANQLNQAGIKFTDFIDRETGLVDQARLQAAIEAAQDEADARDNATNSMATFMDTLATLQAAFQTNIVNPLMDAVAPALNMLVDAIRGPIGEDGEPLGESGFLTAITKIGDYINNDLAPGILKFIEAFKEDPMGTINEYFMSAVSGIGDMIKDFFLGPLKNTRPDGSGADVRSGGFLEETLMPILSDIGSTLVNGMIEGVTTFWDESSGFTKAMIAGAAALFIAGGPLSTAMVAGATAAFGAARSAIRNRANTTPRTGATVGRDPKTGRFTSLNNTPNASGGGRIARLLGRGARFIPGVGLAVAGGMGLYDSISGYNADPDAGFLESMGNAGSSLLNGLSFGLLGQSSSEIAAGAGNSPSATPTVNNPSISSNIEQLNSLDADSVRQYTSAMERLVEVLGDLNEELAPSQNSRGRGRNATNAGSVLAGSGLGMGSEQLNTTMQNIYLLLQEMRDLDVKVERNTSRISSGNIANGSVSTVSP